MPRGLRIRVQDFSRRRPKHDYAIRVMDVARSTQAGALLVRYQHEGDEQAGRCGEFNLPVPARPEGFTASFLRACGIEVTAGMEIEVGQVIHQVILARFDASDQPATFSRLKPPTGSAHEHQSKHAQSAARPDLPDTGT